MVFGKICQQVRQLRNEEVIVAGENQFQVHYYLDHEALPIVFDIMWCIDQRCFIITRKEYADEHAFMNGNVLTLTRFAVKGCYTLRDVLKALDVKIHRMKISADDVIQDQAVVLNQSVEIKWHIELSSVSIWAKDGPENAAIMLNEN